MSKKSGKHVLKDVGGMFFRVLTSAYICDLCFLCGFTWIFRCA